MPANTLADLTSPGLIVPSLRGQDVAGVIEELSQALQRENRVPDMLPVFQTALKRELQVSTDMEAGMAFPHARLPGLMALSFALGRSAEPLGWTATAARSVRLVFLMAVPENDAAQYLSLISGIVRLAKDTALVNKLLTVPDSAQMFEVLQQIPLRPDPKPKPK
jgi:fructose PTS system EIIA component